MASFKSIVKSKFIVVLAFFIYLLILAILILSSFNWVEPKAYNYMLNKYSVNPVPDDDSILIVIDDKSVARYRWPWKRELYGKIFTYLHKYTDAKFIAFDAILNADDINNPESDRKLYESIKNINNFVGGFMPMSEENADDYYSSEFYPKFRAKFSVNVNDKRKNIENSHLQSVMSMPNWYLNGMKNAGSVFIFKNNLDYLNTTFQLIRVGDDFYPSLSLKLYLLEHNTNAVTLTDNSLIIDKTGLKIPGVAYSGGFYNDTKFYKPVRVGNSAYSHKVVSAIDIIDSIDAINSGKKPLILPDIFKNKVVFVGANASATSIGLADRISTPVLNEHPGVDYQAVNYDNLVNGDFMRCSQLWQDTLIVLILGIIVFSFIYSLSFIWSLLLILFVFVIYYVINIYCYKNNFSMALVTPLLSGLWTMVFAYSSRMIIEGKNKEKIKNAMGRYLSQDIMKNVVKHIDDIKLGGKKANVTVLFADIRGFTSMSEKMKAEDVSLILNEYFTEIEPIITKHNGVINKFIGDAVMAIFGEPIQDINHPQNAVKCACEMLEKVAELRNKWVIEGKPEINIGIGINTGEAFVGNIGSEKRLEYTVIGDMVNLASRIESYNKVYKSNLLISSSTYEQVSSIVEVVKISDVKIRGKAKKMDIYEVLKIC